MYSTKKIMMRRLLSIFCFWVLLCSFWAACDPVDKRLSIVETLVEEKPDSVLNILRTSFSVQELNDRDQMRYHLLLIQAMDKCGQSIVEMDSLIDRITGYYADSDNFGNKAFCYFYKGRICYDIGHYEEAAVAFKKAEEYALRAGNKRLASLICNNLGYTDYESDLYPEAIVQFRKVFNYAELGLNSETCVAFNITSKEQVIINTWYGGEMKKGMFSMMNYYLPLKGIASMHCSANCDMEGKHTAVFFGLSGTGKTTLSTDPKRLLIGDDEHGWDDNGVFNFEGGCYAKVIGLDKESEPDIYNAIRRDALLENVTVDAAGKIDFDDKSVTENTRVSYPIDHIEKIASKVNGVSAGPAAENVIFLSADAFGVLPPVSILTPEQTKYYFLSGFTAKLAGTERGITEPTPTFSACFGQAFLELHPTKYAEELVKKMEKSGAKAYLVNTGWNGTGKRITIKDTRGIIDAILSGDIKTAPTKKIPMFNFEVPTELPGVDPAILDPRDTYADPTEWETKAKDLAERFQKNFQKYTTNDAGKALVAAGPKAE